MTSTIPKPGFTVLYEHEAVLVLNKPAGVLTQAPRGVDSIEVRLREYLDGLGTYPQPLYIGLVHRLDRPVTGAIIFTYRKKAAQKLGKQFERREVEKTYWACVHGTVATPTGEWVDHVRKIPNQAHAEVVPPDHPEGREARLTYQVLGHFEGGTWLEIQLQTGRMHQIRIQASTHGHPIWGDRQYGSAAMLGPEKEDPREQPIALHARRLTFTDPALKERVTVEAPLPEYWNDLKLPAVE